MSGDGRLRERTAIVTGAGQGIGRGIARALALEGARVVVAEIDEARGTAVAGELASLLPEVSPEFVQCDVSVPDSIAHCVDQTLARCGGIDILVNNAVFNAPLTSFVEHDDALWLAALQTGLLGTFRFMKACHPHMCGRGGRIINLGSMAGYQGWEKCAAYAAVKEGIRALSKVAAREWGADGITVNVLCPFANSPGWKGFVEASPEAAQRQIDGTLVRRIGDCERDVGTQRRLPRE